MTQPRSMLHFREATVDDAWLVADLETAIVPDDPRDGVLLRFWWTHPFGAEAVKRWIRVEDGSARAFVFAAHAAWEDGAVRYGSTRVRVHPGEWAEDTYVELLEHAAEWLRDEGATVTVSRVREDLTDELSVLGRVGFREVRRDRQWRLDLVRNRDRLLATRERTLADMRRQGVRLLTFDQDVDPDKHRKLYQLDIETTKDIPHTVPIPEPSYEEWWSLWFEHPGHHADRIWIARDGDEIIGMSAIGYPPQRGVPWTGFTCTSRSARGRGIARALKYETVAQAIALGAQHIGTTNDSTNAPILHLNQEMGYEPSPSVLELHRDIPNG